MSEMNDFRDYVEEQQHLCYGVEGGTPGVHGRLARQYDFLLETIDTYQEINQPQLNDNQMIKTHNNLVKINDLAFELQHDGELTKEQWDKVGQIYKLSLPMQLNESQQIVLEWLKACAERFTFSVMYPIFHLGDYDRRVLEGPRQIDRAFSELNFRQEAQVLQAYSQWALEQEEEG